jgi:O-methyltransferase involved in polyketide biosynthesis
VRRAAHQVLDGPPRVFDDPLAVAIAGPDNAYEPQSSFSRALRAFIAARSRYAEDRLAAAVQRGVRQYVVLGAGLAPRNSPMLIKL